MQKIKLSWEEELKFLQNEMASRINKREFSLKRRLKAKWKLFWGLFRFCFLWKDENIKLSMEDFPDNFSEGIIKKLEVDWTISPKLYRATYTDGHIETF